MSLESLDRHPVRGPLGWTVTISLATGLVALGLVHHLARVVDKAESPRHGALARGIGDPDVTGSIASAARSMPLDPCSVRERLVIRGP